MPRVYHTKGDKRRAEAITALFTKEEKYRVMKAALAANMAMSVYVHHVVLQNVESIAA